MKKIFAFFALAFLMVSGFAQKIAKVTLTRDGQVEMFSFNIDNGITLNMTKDGNITEWGSEVYSDRNQTLTRLEKYLGRVEYYSNTDNEAFRGKVKYIGMTAITYYGTYDREEMRGKVRSIGTTIFEYFSKNENESLGGIIKTVGSLGFGWYTTFDNEAFRGKLRNIGTTTLTYYATYDDKAIIGRIKSIDRATFTYYTSNERREYAGMLKSGTQQQFINGIKYYVKF
ncbi:MAG: hypothetical protein ABIO04_07035 [Ferruginibacter sp.]